MGGKRLRQVLEEDGGRAVNQRSASVMAREFKLIADQLRRAIDYAERRAIGAFSEDRLSVLRGSVVEAERAAKRAESLKASFARTRALEIAGPDRFAPHVDGASE